MFCFPAGILFLSPKMWFDDSEILNRMQSISARQIGESLLCVGRIQNRTQIKRVKEFALMEEKSNQRGVSALTSDCIDKRCQIGGCCVEFDLNSSEFRCWYTYFASTHKYPAPRRTCKVVCLPVEIHPLQCVYGTDADMIKAVDAVGALANLQSRWVKWMFYYLRWRQGKQILCAPKTLPAYERQALKMFNWMFESWLPAREHMLHDHAVDRLALPIFSSPPFRSATDPSG